MDFPLSEPFGSPSECIAAGVCFYCCGTGVIDSVLAGGLIVCRLCDGLGSMPVLT